MPSAPKTLDYLAAQFVGKQARRQVAVPYDHRDRGVSAGQPLAPRPEETPLLANAAQRLRGDQLYTAITSVLGIAGAARAPARKAAAMA